jgi:DNA gyrase/topoisomerase IV subunit B
MNEKYKMPTLCAAYSQDNMGGKGKKSGVTNKGYTDKTMGVHGAGAYVVNACSEFLTVRTRIYNEERNCVDIYEMGYREGIPIENEGWLNGRLKYVGEDHTKIGNGRNNTGLTTIFKPDLKIMSLYNARTEQIEEDYYLDFEIKKKIVDTLYSVTDPVIVSLDIDGQVSRYDSREISYTYGKEEGKDYLRLEVEPTKEMKEKMALERVSDFCLDLVIMPLDDPYEATKYEGFVNRIKVSQSPHINVIKVRISSDIQRRCREDSDLNGYYRGDQVKGIKVIPLLYVEQAEWSGQVKTEYSDSRVAGYMGQLLAQSKVLDKNGHFEYILDYCFQCTKPWLLADRDKSEKIEKMREEQIRKEKSIKKDKKLKEKLNEDLRYLNKEGSFIFSANIEDSWVVIVEGRAAGSVFKPIIPKIRNLAVFTGMWGKIDNANKLEDINKKVYRTLQDIEDSGQTITVADKLDVIYSSPFARYLLMTDNDADGRHMNALQRFYIWKRHRKVIEEGRLFDILPPYCDYTASAGLTYTFKGEVKELSSSGSLRTMEECEIVRRVYPDKVKFKLFKGLGSLTSGDIYRTLTNQENWSQVLPLTPEEEYQIDKMFTDSSLFKKVFTEVNYMDEMCIRKNKMKRVVYKDTRPNIEQVVNSASTSDYPVFTSISRRNLEDYEERGSDVAEIDTLKRQLEKVKEDYGNLY